MRKEGPNEYSWTTQEVVDALLKKAKKQYKGIPKDADVDLKLMIDERGREHVVLTLIPKEEDV